MRLKDQNINTIGIKPELIIAIMVANDVYKEYSKDMVITSLNDSTHSYSSLHYAGAAVDLRTSYFNDQEKAEVVSKIKDRLNGDYDVVLESDHIHLEWQPKTR